MDMCSLNASLIAFNPHQFSRDQGGVKLNPRSVCIVILTRSGPSAKEGKYWHTFFPILLCIAHRTILLFIAYNSCESTRTQGREEAFNTTPANLVSPLAE